MPIVTLPGGQRFGLARALAISLVAHAVLLWPASQYWARVAIAPSPLIAQLRPVLPPQAVGDRETPNPAAKKSVAPNAPTTSQALPPQPGAPLANATSLTPAADSRSANAVAALVESPGLPLLAPVASSLEAANGIDPEGLRGYRLALAREARHHKHYPALAIEAGWIGTVELRVSVGSGGSQTASLANSSGHETLDAAALEMIRRVLPAKLPPSLQGRSFEVSLPVRYELPD